MNKHNTVLASMVLATAVVVAGGLQSPSASSGDRIDDVIAPRAAYVYKSDQEAATEYAELLAEDGIVTTLVPQADLGATALSRFDLILIGSDTGVAEGWGDGAAVEAINRSGTPIVALGAGGSAFLGQLGLTIGASNARGEVGTTVQVADRDLPVYRGPHPIPLPDGDELALFEEETAIVAVALPVSPRPDVLRLGLLESDEQLHPFLQQDARHLFWGYEGLPSEMTDAGRALFLNTADHMLQFAGAVDTLILTNYQRMLDLGYTFSPVSDLANTVRQLETLPRDESKMVATTRDLTTDAPDYVTSAYAAWSGHEGDITKTNALVDAIRKFIWSLKKGAFSNLKNVILVGSHEVIPMQARKVTNGHDEAEWADDWLPQKSGYLYDIYHDTTSSPDGHFLSDLVYRNWSQVESSPSVCGGGAPPGGGSGILRCCNPASWIDCEYLPELAVGRLIETPDQIEGVLDAYIARKGNLSRFEMVVVASQDMVKAGNWAAQYMGPLADTSLVRSCASSPIGKDDGCFPSSLVPPKLNAKHDIVVLGGHGHVNELTTQKWHEKFRAGNDANQGDTSELNLMPGAVVVSAGSCHLGLNYGNKLYHAPDGTPTYASFAEEFAEKQVGTYIGATTVAVGDCCAKKLTTDFVDKLLNSGYQQTTGGAHLDAVQQYLDDHNDSSAFGLNTHRQTIAEEAFYGMPTYGWSAPIMIKKKYDFTIQHLACQDCPVFPRLREELVWKLHRWALLPDGEVQIEGATRGSGGVDLPLLPRVRRTRVLPIGSSIADIVWDEAGSTSIVIQNDVPLDRGDFVNNTVDGVVRVGTGVFAYDDFYPPVPFMWTTSSVLGGNARETEFVVSPIQYNPMTHETRIWTRLAFVVDYEASEEDFGFDGDSDTLPDYWEAGHGLDRYDHRGAEGADGDPDDDGAPNSVEQMLETHPANPDSDFDGLADGAEDANGDGSVGPGETSPVLWDTDGDGIDDGEELARGSDPLDPGSASAQIEKTLLEGPRPLEIALPYATRYLFKISYSNPEQQAPVRIKDTVPAEFEILSATASVGNVRYFRTGRSRHGGANRLEWDLAEEETSGTLVVEVQTVQSPGRGHRSPVFKPTSCGPLLLNDGAVAYQVDRETGAIAETEVTDPRTGEIALGPTVVIGPSDPLVIEAVEGARPCE